MKHSFKGLFVVLAIMMSFVLVQGVWAQADIVTFVGTVKTAANRSIGLDTNGDDETDVTVDHMGPSWYWDEMGVTYPCIGDDLTIETYDGANGYVGVSVILDEYNSINLRDPDTLKPLWTQIAETKDLSGCPDGGDCEPVDHDYDHYYSYESKGPNGKNF
jgi:hypothetical protein